MLCSQTGNRYPVLSGASRFKCQPAKLLRYVSIRVQVVNSEFGDAVPAHAGMSADVIVEAGRHWSLLL